MSNVLLISGSPSATSKSAAVLEYARGQLAADKLTATIVSVRDFPPEDLLLGKYDSPAFDELKKLIEGADGLIVSTPIYKAAYTGALKALFDILPQAALRGKTVLPIATGGSLAHLLAIDYALKPVLSALGATELLQGVYIVDKQLTLSADGEIGFADDELRTRLRESVAQLAAIILGASPEPTPESESEVRGAHASRVSAWASRPSHPNRSRRDAESSTRDACAPRTGEPSEHAR